MDFHYTHALACCFTLFAVVISEIYLIPRRFVVCFHGVFPFRNQNRDRKTSYTNPITDISEIHV